MFGELQIVACRRVRGCGGRRGWQSRLGQNLDSSLPLPLRGSVGVCPPEFWPLLGFRKIGMEHRDGMGK